MSATALSIVALIAGLTQEGMKLFQAWCMQNPNASDEEAREFLISTNDDATAAYQRSQDKAQRLQAEQDLRDAQLRDPSTQG